MSTSKSKKLTEADLPNTAALTQEVVVNLPLSELHPFPNHPFQVREDDSMKETAESIKQFGVLVPAIVRPVPDGGYEIVAGHKQRNTPLYPNPVSYASEHDELEAYRASYKANTACKKAIEDAINGNYKDWSLDSKPALAQVSELFSMERITYVLAATVQHKDWDGRLSDTNKAWAKTVPVCEDRNIYAFVVDQAHTGLVDLFVNQVRKELAVPQEERRPSVMEKLKAAPVKNAPKISAHSKGQEL